MYATDSVYAVINLTIWSVFIVRNYSYEKLGSNISDFLSFSKQGGINFRAVKTDDDRTVYVDDRNPHLPRLLN